MTQPALEVEGLNVSYEMHGRLVPAVSDLSFRVAPGGSLAVVGESGSGKSSAINGILRMLPDNGRVVSGRVSVQGTELTTLDDEQLRQMRAATISLVPQAAMNALDPVIRVDRQIAEVVRTHTGISRRDALRVATDALELVGIARDRADAYPHQFSGGMRQRALIAMATALRPAVLIADEPTTGLDVIVQQHLLEVFGQLQEELDLAIVLITHDLGVAVDLCSDVVVMRDGVVVERGPTKTVMEHPADPYTQELVAVGGSSEAAQRPSSESPALRFSSAGVRYSSGRGLRLGSASDVVAVHGVDLALRRGEILGLAGQSGCGKSSLACAALGLSPLSDGVIECGSVTIGSDASAKDWGELRRHVQMIFQDPYESLNPRFTVERTLQDARISQKLDRDPQAVREALRMAQLTPVEDYLQRRPHSLSGGERQRVAIARTLVVDPDIVIADEPVSMLDRTTANQIAELLISLAQERDISLLIISHDLGLLRRTCQRIAVMYGGRLVELGPTEELIQRPQHPYTRALLKASHIDTTDLAGRSDSRQSRRSIGSHGPSPGGCIYLDQCERSHDDCGQAVPELHDHSQHGSACFHPLEPSE